MKVIRNQQWGLIFLSLFVGLVLALGVWMLYSPDWNKQATVGAFIIAILTPLLSSIFNKFIPEFHLHHLLVVFVSAIISLLLALFVMFWAIAGMRDLIFHSTSEDISYNISLKGNSSMTNSAKAQATLPGTQHEHLKLIFKLDNSDPTGSCVASSEITVIPLSKNGARGEKLTAVRNDAGQRLIELDNIRNVQGLEIILNQKDPHCAVNVTIYSAIYSQ
jgi:hypothetical protein